MPPERVVCVLGTGTGVGKTWVTCALITELRRGGMTVAARKPAQSYEPGEEAVTDAHLLGAASGEHPERVTPRHRWYPAALAPPMAAEVLGAPPFSIGELAAELASSWGSGAGIGIVETAGGACSPLAADGDCVAFTEAIGATDVVLVADAGLGTIHAVRAAARATGPGTVVYLNRYDGTAPHDLHARNAEWLRRDGLEVLTAVEDLAGRVSSAP